MVQAALVGSILGNSLLVFGFALFIGGLKNGTQRFKSEPPKMIATLMILAFAALAIPTLAHELHTPASGHINQLDKIVAVVLLFVLVASIYFSVKGDKAIAPDANKDGHHATWSLGLTIAVLALAGSGGPFIRLVCRSITTSNAIIRN